MSGFATIHDGQTYDLEDLWRFHERLEGARIVTQDWKKTLADCDSAGHRNLGPATRVDLRSSLDPDPSPAVTRTEPGSRLNRSQPPRSTGLTRPLPFRDDLRLWWSGWRDLNPRPLRPEADQRPG